MRIFTPEELDLTESVQEKIKIEVKETVPYANYVVQQPKFSGSKEISLAELLSLEPDYNNFPISSSKVKDIITKHNTGLLSTDLFMFSPIVVGSVKGGKEKIISGRHRASAIATISRLCGLPDEETKVEVIMMEFESEELMALSILSYNATRSLYKGEVERIMMASELDGQPPNLNNVADYVGSDRKTELFFRQFCLHVIHSKGNHSKLISDSDILSKVKPLMTDNLKAGDHKDWGNLKIKLQQMVSTGEFYQ